MASQVLRSIIGATGCCICFVFVLYLHQLNTTPISGLASLSLFPLDIFNRNINSQEINTDERFPELKLKELEHRLAETVDKNVKRIRSQNRTTRVKAAHAPDAQELILLVSSLGRGGSSWIGELLSNIKDEVMYLFEPIKIVPSFYNSRVTPAYSSKIMSVVLSCQFSNDFVEFQKQWDGLFRKYPDVGKKRCQTAGCMSRRCRLAEAVVVKTIRLPLAHVEDILNRPSLRHLKIIYLARDPRARVLSRLTVFNMLDTKNECPRIEADVFAFHRLSQLFPGHFYFMRYEDMCQDPMGEAAQLWRFLQTNHSAEMPSSWRTFLKDHVKNKGKISEYTTYRNSATEWGQWRLEMGNSTKVLLDVEKECYEAMDKMGYIPLHTLANVKNLSMPFIKNYNCDFWDCGSYRF